MLWGLGKLGQEIAKELIEGEHEVIVIDINESIIEEFTNEYDAVGIVGNGASRQIEQKAKASSADVLIALSGSDEVNLMSCITAKTLGTKYTIARVDGEEYKDDERYLMKKIGIDLVINEEYDTAMEISRLISYPSTIKTRAFANGKVDMAEIIVEKNSLLENLKLSKVKEKFGLNIIVASIIRKNKLIIPRGDVTLEKGDEVFFIAKNSDIYNLLRKLGLIDKPVKTLFLVGCGKIGKYLLDDLKNRKLKIKIIDSDKDRCIELAEEFPEATIIHGDGTDSKMLIEEEIKDYDCCISLTDDDETNIVVTLFAWSNQVRKIITKVVSLNYAKMLKYAKINNTLSPRFIILSGIHRFIRGIDENRKYETNIKSLHRFSKNMAEVIEFEITEEFDALGKTIKDIGVVRDVVIAFIIREEEIIIPSGRTTIEKNDRVIVIVAANKNIGSIEDIIEK